MLVDYDIRTSLGKIDNELELDFLNENQINELNSIGYSGKNTKGEKISRIEYLNSLNKGEFTIKQLEFDNGTFRERYLITRYIKN